MLVKVKNIPDFLTFIAIAQAQKIPYDIIGAEDKAPTMLNGRYVLFSPSFTVYMSLSRPLSPPPLTPFEFRLFKRVALNNGILECES